MPDGVSSARPDDDRWMALAISEAARGRGHVEPNPMVGAVVVRDGSIVAMGHHRAFGGPHAEVDALRRAGDGAAGSTLFVSLEPCCHVGKTPPCTDAILSAGVARVVAALRDPFPRVDGGGFRRLAEAGVAVTSGVLEVEARRLLGPYLKRIATGRPFVTAKWAMTLDGKSACASGDSRWISNARSRAMVHEARGRMDAVAVGIGTAIADDPSLTARPAGPRTPLRVVLDGSARLPTSSALARTARDTPVLVATTRRAPADRVAALRAAGCEVVAFDSAGPVPVVALLDELGGRGLTNVLIEGGGTVLGAFLDAGEVDEVDAFVAPIIEGGAGSPTPAAGIGRAWMSGAIRLDRPSIASLDGDVRIGGRIRRPWWDA